MRALPNKFITTSAYPLQPEEQPKAPRKSNKLWAQKIALWSLAVLILIALAVGTYFIGPILTVLGIIAVILFLLQAFMFIGLIVGCICESIEAYGIIAGILYSIVAIPLGLAIGFILCPQ